MAYDEKLAERIRAVLGRRRGISEKRMFGGLAFLANGHMCCGIVKDELMLRLGEDGVQKALKRAHVREMDFTGRVSKKMVYVGKKGFARQAQLRTWVDQALDFARSLPPKP